MTTAIVCFRQDLRISDNPALISALACADRIVPYVYDPKETTGRASRWWLHHSLAALSAQLSSRGAELVLLDGTRQDPLLPFALKIGASSVHWNRTYDPLSVARDTALKRVLREHGIAGESYRGNLLFEPWEIQNKSDAPFRVFTPFWKVALSKLDEVAPPAPAPKKLIGVPSLRGVSLDSLKLLPTIPWDRGFGDWVPGEDGAKRALTTFLKGPAAAYISGRDVPSTRGTSRLSPHLHFGEISSRQILDSVSSAQLKKHAPGFLEHSNAFLRQIGWRDFAHHVLFAFPRISNEPLDFKFQKFAWETNTSALAAWQRGRTGIPIVDAGMRELWATGWCHNRVRMIVGSFLTKNLLIHWQEGLHWFDDTLVDADLANNIFGWQWISGCGADAAPYFRIFNPISQSERFDPKGEYLKKWLPVLAEVPLPWMHKPFECPPLLLSAAGVTLGVDYPHPIVDLKSTRERALTKWADLRA